jgi:hypothetical protein
MPSPRSTRSIAIVLAVFGIAVLHAMHLRHLPDDAYISFRVAQNFASGEGLVFNPGEYVMAYSNFLWVILLGAGNWIGIDSPTLAPVLGGLFCLGILALVFTSLQKRHGDPAAATAALAVLAFSPTFAFWLQGGLEGPMFAFFLLLGVVLTWEAEASDEPRRYAVIGLVFGLAALSRPEGVFYAVPAAAYLLWRRRTKRRATRVALFLGVTVAMFTAFTLWMLVYYGDPLPNPYYAKAHPLSLEVLARGWRISALFVAGYLGAPVLVIVAWALATRLLPSARGWLPLSVIAAFVVFYLRVGGDLQIYYRMWFWVLPMLALLLGEAVVVFSSEPRRRVIAIAVALLVVGLHSQHTLRGREHGRVPEDERFVRGALLIGDTLARLHPGARVAANNVGALAYASRLHVVDMLGLTDRHIAKAPGKRVGIPAHESHDGAYVLAARPDFIFLGMPLAFSQRLPLGYYLSGGGYPSDLDLAHGGALFRAYELYQLPLPDGRFAPVFRRVRD